MYVEMSNALFTKEMLKNRLRQWRNSTPSKPFGGLLAGALVAKSNTDEHLKATLGITDAKSLYDSVKREAKSKEWRVALAVSEIKQTMAIVDAGIRWIPTT